MPSIEDPDPDAAVIAAAALARRHHAKVLRLARVREHQTVAEEQRTDAAWGAALTGRVAAIMATSRPVITPAGVAARADAVALACGLADDEEFDSAATIFLAASLARNLRSLIRQANAS